MRRAATAAFAGRRGPHTSLWSSACIATKWPLLLQGASLSHSPVGARSGGGVQKIGPRREQQQQQRGNSKNKNNNSGPVKDRFPPVATDLSDPRRRLALLVDASSIEPHVFRNTILPAAQKVGVPVLVRIFAVQLSSGWESLVAGGDMGSTIDCSAANEERKQDIETGTEGSKNSTPRCPPVEFFRVERFIPVSMQMEADANHIFDFRRQNKIEAVCFACSEVDRGVFEGFLPTIAGNGFNQYVLDELGMAKEVLEDGRSADGA